MPRPATVTTNSKRPARAAVTVVVAAATVATVVVIAEAEVATADADVLVVKTNANGFRCVHSKARMAPIGFDLGAIFLLREKMTLHLPYSAHMSVAKIHVLVFALLLLFSGCMDYAQRARNKQVEAAVEAAGGSIDRAGDFHKSDDYKQLPSDAIVHINLGNADLSKIHLSEVFPLESVVYVNLEGAAFYDHQINYLLECSNLRHLEIGYTNITDESVGKLCDKPRLKYINVAGCNVTDRSVESLLRVEDLEGFHVWDTHVTKDAFERLKKEKKLGSLSAFGNTVVSEEVRLALVDLNRRGIVARSINGGKNSKFTKRRYHVDVPIEAEIDQKIQSQIELLQESGEFEFHISSPAFFPLLNGLKNIRCLVIWNVGTSQRRRNSAEELTADDYPDIRVDSLESLSILAHEIIPKVLIQWIQIDGIEELKLDHQNVDIDVWNALLNAPDLESLTLNDCTFADIDSFGPSLRPIRADVQGNYYGPQKDYPGIIARLLGEGKDFPMKDSESGSDS